MSVLKRSIQHGPITRFGASLLGPTIQIKEPLASWRFSTKTSGKLTSYEIQNERRMFPLSAAGSLCKDMHFSLNLYFQNVYADPRTMRQALNRLSVEMPFITGKLQSLPGIIPKPSNTVLSVPTDRNRLSPPFTCHGTSKSVADVLMEGWGATARPFYLLDGNSDQSDFNCMKDSEEEHDRCKSYPVLQLGQLMCADGTALKLQVSHAIADASRALEIIKRLTEIYESIRLKRDEPAKIWAFDSWMMTMMNALASQPATASRMGGSTRKKNRVRLWDVVFGPLEIFRYFQTQYQIVHFYVPWQQLRELRDQIQLMEQSPQRISVLDVIQATLMTLVMDVRRGYLTPRGSDTVSINMDLTRHVQHSNTTDWIGNASHILTVASPHQEEEIQWSSADPWLEKKSKFMRALARNASLIRRSINEFRSMPQNIIDSIIENERLSNVPSALLQCAFIVQGNKHKVLNTTAIASLPMDSVKLHGKPSSAYQVFSVPSFDWFTIIQDSGTIGPYNDGLICTITAECKKVHYLVKHPAISMLFENGDRSKKGACFLPPHDR